MQDKDSPVEILTAAHFAPYRGGAFQVEGWPHPLLLREIHESPGGAGFRAPFNLVFQGPRHDLLAEGLRRMAAVDGPAFELYLMPVSTPEPDRQDYQAAFN
jgi:hypothetical protein